MILNEKINKDGIFLPEYILEIKENNNISLDILNLFLKNDFPKIYLNKDNDCLSINDLERKNISGYCIKLKDLETSKGTNNNNVNTPKVVNKDNIELITNISGATPKEQQNKSENIKEIDPYIELMLNIYLFKEELKNKVKRSLKDSFEEKFYIIEKKWM